MSGDLSSSRRYSLTKTWNGSSARPGGSTGRCRSLDLEWLLSLDKKRRSHRKQQGYSLVAEDVIPKRTNLEENSIIDDLKSQNFTIGLARTLIRNTDSFNVRIWLVNNSGSMNNVDGHRMIQSKDGRMNMVNCSRWEEVTSTVLWHAKVNAKLEAPMVIRLVNDPGVIVEPQQLGIAASEHVKVQEELDRLSSVFQCHPGCGNTSVATHLKDLLASLNKVDPAFLEDKIIFLLLVTDGLPSDAEGEEGEEINQDFLDTLTCFQTFPVWIVIRLATDEQSTVDFYNRLDHGVAVMQIEKDRTRWQAEEAHLNVLEDFVSEAKRVARHNPWLNYSYPLHLSRESGVNFIASFGAINDRPLVHNELAGFVGLLFDRSSRTAGERQAFDDQPLPDPLSDYRRFRNEVQAMNGRFGCVWNPIRKKALPWINMKELDRIYGSGELVSNTTSAFGTCSCQIS